MTSQPLVTRRLRICFDVEVQVLPLPEDVLADSPESPVLQQALIECPELLNKTLAYYAFDGLFDHLTEMQGVQSWLPVSPDGDLLDAARSVDVKFLHRLLFENLVYKATLEYVSPIVFDNFATRLVSQAEITDLESGEHLSWNTPSTSLVRHVDDRRRFLLAEVQGEQVLCLNLVSFDPDDIIDAAAYELEAGFQRILVFLSDADFSPEEQDDLVVRLAETFGEMPVEIYTCPNIHFSYLGAQP